MRPILRTRFGGATCLTKLDGVGGGSTVHSGFVRSMRHYGVHVVLRNENGRGVDPTQFLRGGEIEGSALSSTFNYLLHVCDT